MLKTRLTELLGVRHPIVSAPMTPQAGGALARAVTDAGGFGIIGFDENESLESLKEQVAIAREGNLQRKFGVGLVRWAIERRPELFEYAIACKPHMVSLSFGDLQPYIERLHETGILVASQVQSREIAERAEGAGADLIVVQGTEAGGHTGAVGTLPLLQLVLDRVKAPVVAAGGIATGRGLAAVIAAGAEGGWIGTPFLVARESRTRESAQAKIIAANETQTVLTSVFDRIQEKPWPRQFRGRALVNDFERQWDGHEDEMMEKPGIIEAFVSAKSKEDYSIANIYAGQSVGLIKAVTTAGEIVTRISREAEAYLSAAAKALQ